MKKPAFALTALATLSALPFSAQAEMALSLGGYFSGYGVWADNEIANTRTFDLRRDAEVHVSGETTLDNGLTVGFHTEQDLGGATYTNEVYAYFSGNWGRVNFGTEDGAAYLLQVAAPSADNNIDGLRTYINAITAKNVFFTGVFDGVPGLPLVKTMSYGHLSDPYGTESTDRITYFTPKVGGFQAGLSYTPYISLFAADTSATAAPDPDNQLSLFDDSWEASLRWDGSVGDLGISAGAGYSLAGLQAEHPIALGGTASTTAPRLSDGQNAWNAGLNLSWQNFSLGGSWLRINSENANGLDLGSDTNTIDFVDYVDVAQDTIILGTAWDNGPWHLGASWMNRHTGREASGTFGADDGVLRELDAAMTRYTVGAGYAFGPGMTVNAALAWGGFDNATKTANDGNAGTNDRDEDDNFTGSPALNNDFTQITLGTQIKF